MASAPLPGMAVKVGQQLVAELFQLDQQVVGRGHVGHDAHRAAALVRELGPLVEHQHALDLGAGDEEELLVLVGGQFLEAFVQEQGADGVAPRTSFGLRGVLRLDPVQAFQKLVGPPDLRAHARRCSCGARAASLKRPISFSRFSTSAFRFSSR